MTEKTNTVCDIDGVIIVELQKYSDKRGWLIELFRSDNFPQDFSPAMSYVSLTRPGEVRGPHEHVRQSDYIIFTGPSMFRIYLWDNRTGSPSHGRHFNAEFGENRMAAIYIPPGVVHGYKNIGSVDGITINAPDQLYRGVGKLDEVDEIRHEDNPDSPFVIDRHF